MADTERESKKKSRKKDVKSTASEAAPKAASDSGVSDFPKTSLRDLIANAGAALDDLDTAPPESKHSDGDEAANDSGSENSSDYNSPAKSRRAKKAPTSPSRVSEIDWNRETSNLDFDETPAQNAKPNADSVARDDDDALSRFEDLARRIAQTVSQHEDGTPDDEDAELIATGTFEAPEVQAMSENEIPETLPESLPENETAMGEESELIASEMIAAELGESAVETEGLIVPGRSDDEGDDTTLVAEGELSMTEAASFEVMPDMHEEGAEITEAGVGHELGAISDEEPLQDFAAGERAQMGFATITDADSESENDASSEPAEFIENDQMISIVESLLFSTDKPVSLATIKQIFKGTNVRTKDVLRALDHLASDYAAQTRGVALEEINGGYQLRTKSDNAEFLKRLAKTRPFRLSGPALEVMSIVAYKQPVTKHEVDEIRGVESGHLLRALMERHLVCFNGKAENLPGKPMAYGTTRKFLETFGLRNLKELPTLSEIDELLPEGIGEVEEKETLADLTERLSTEVTSSYSEGDEELGKINDQLQKIDTSSEFFEQEKVRERERRDRERAQDIRERIVMDDNVEEKDKRWLDRYEAKLVAQDTAAAAGEPGTTAVTEIEDERRIGGELETLTAENQLSGEVVSAGAVDSTNESEDEISNEELALIEDADTELEANLDWDEDFEAEEK